MGNLQIRFGTCLTNGWLLPTRPPLDVIVNNKLTQNGNRAGHQHREQPHENDFDAGQPLGGVVPAPERIPDAQVPAQADEAHVQDAGGAGQHVTRHVDVTPGEPKRPVTWRKKNGRRGEKIKK